MIPEQSQRARKGCGRVRAASTLCLTCRVGMTSRIGVTTYSKCLPMLLVVCFVMCCRTKFVAMLLSMCTAHSHRSSTNQSKHPCVLVLACRFVGQPGTTALMQSPEPKPRARCTFAHNLDELGELRGTRLASTTHQVQPSV